MNLEEQIAGSDERGRTRLYCARTHARTHRPARSCTAMCRADASASQKQPAQRLKSSLPTTDRGWPTLFVEFSHGCHVVGRQAGGDGLHEHGPSGRVERSRTRFGFVGQVAEAGIGEDRCAPGGGGFLGSSERALGRSTRSPFPGWRGGLAASSRRTSRAFHSCRHPLWTWP